MYKRQGLDTVPTSELFEFLEKYLAEEEVDTIVIGEPLHADGNPTQIEPLVQKFVEKIKKRFPEVKIDLMKSIPLFEFELGYIIFICNKV